MKSGIYKLTSKATNKCYVGLSNDVYYRKRKHIETLKGNRHFNNYLQNHFNKYGEQDLVFEVIEFCKEEELAEREIHWIEIYKKMDLSFNLSEGGKLKDYISKKYCFENLITGEKYTEISIGKFCAATGLDRSTMYKVIKNKIRCSKNWTVANRPIRERAKSVVPSTSNKPIKLFNTETNEEFCFDSQTQASISLNLNQQSLSKLYSGKQKTCGNFILLENKNKLIMSKLQKEFRLYHAAHGEFAGFNQREFCEKFDLNAGMVSCLLNNKINKYRGWTRV